MAFTLISDEQKQEESPGFFSELGRHGARTATRIGEQAAGFPGDILSLINDYIAGPAVSGYTGEEPIPYEKLGLSQFLPTSQQFRKGTEKEAGELVKPQNKIEKFFDDLVSDATSLITPGKKGIGLLKQAGSALFKSAGANLAKETIKDLSGDEKKGAIGHIGTLALLSFLDKKTAAQAISEGYRPLEEQVKKLSSVSADKLENNLNLLKNKMMKGTQAPSEKFIIDEIDAVLEKIKNGKISPEEAWASKRSLNEKLTKVLFDIPEKKNQQRARKLSTTITHELDDILKQTKKQDPKFYKELKDWNTAYKTVADSNLISKWVERNLKYNPASVGLLHLFGNPLISKSTAGLAAPYHAAKILYRMSKSPKLAKHYSKTLALAGIEDSRSFNKQLKILDKELEKEEKKDRFTLIKD